MPDVAADAAALAVTALARPGFADVLLSLYPYVAERRAAGDTRPLAELVEPRMSGLGDLVARTTRWAASPGPLALPGLAALRPPDPEPAEPVSAIPMPRPPRARAVPRLEGVASRRRVRSA